MNVLYNKLCGSFEYMQCIKIEKQMIKKNYNPFFLNEIQYKITLSYRSTTHFLELSPVTCSIILFINHRLGLKDVIK